MEVKTRQFGTMEVNEADILQIPKGLLGFEGLEQFVLVETEDCLPFRWLQCIDAPDLAFVVVSPVVFFPDYRVAVHAKEVADIEVADPKDVEIYVVVTIPERLEEMTANLQGPILVNTRNNRVKQLVLTDSSYSVAHSVVKQMERTHNVDMHKATPVQIS
jgi:flagellar assembly factor FliW